MQADGFAGVAAGVVAQQQHVVRRRREQHSHWYHGEVSREETERRLAAQGGNGGFLVRYSTSTHKLVLSVIHESIVYHYPIEELADGFYQVHGTSAKYLGVDLLVSEFRRTEHSIVCALGRAVVHGPPPPAIIVYGCTSPLHHAVRKGNLGEVRRVLQEDCRINNGVGGGGSGGGGVGAARGGGSLDGMPLNCNEKAADNGATPLIEAAKTGSNDVILALLEAGAEANLRDCAGFTALHRAVQRSFAHVAETLLKVGHANPQVRCPFSGNTALHEAAVLGHADCVNALLRFHAAPHPRNIDAELPFELAMRFGFQELAEALAAVRLPAPLTTPDDWYQPHLSKGDTETLMRRYGDPPLDGTFLVRRSSAGDRRLVLVVFHRGVALKYAIEVTETAVLGGGESWYIAGGPLHPSIAHLVEHLIRFADGVPVRLRWAVPAKGGSLIDVERLAPRGVERVEREPIRVGKSRHRLVNRKSTSSTSSSSTTQNGESVSRPSGLDTTGGNTADSVGQLPLIPSDQVILLRRLGEGEFGEVYRGQLHRPDGLVVDVAIKVMSQPSARLEFMKEAAMMSALRHPHIVGVFGVCENKRLMMLLELCPLGSLLEQLRSQSEVGAIPDDMLLLYAAQVADGMAFLESRGYVHRDLAARNVLLAAVQLAKISDFGLSRAVGADTDYYRATRRGKWPVKWYAPEAIYYRLFSSASDVWSFGVCLWEMWSGGEHPWGDCDGVEVLRQIEEGGRLTRPSRASPQIYALMVHCWAYKPEERPSFIALADWLREVTSNVYENLPAFPAL